MTLTWEDVLKFLVGSGILAATASWMFFQWRKGKGQAAMTAASEWEAVANARQAENDSLEKELKVLQVRLAEEREARAMAERAHNECTQSVLRLLARMERLQAVVNDLQRELGKPVTDFSDPLHRSETPDRKH